MRANLLLQRILEKLAEEGFLEPVAAADGTEGYRITDAGCDYLDQLT
jgi:DNA-binding PadR family transcriptional regulator